jgi:hypothetical protein
MARALRPADAWARAQVPHVAARDLIAAATRPGFSSMSGDWRWDALWERRIRAAAAGAR